MLAYYLEWHMRQALKPILFDDHDRPSAEAARISIVAKAKRSEAGASKAAAKRTEDGLPVHSFRSLLADLATVTRNTMAMVGQPDATFIHYPQLAPRLPAPRSRRQRVASNHTQAHSNPRVGSDTCVPTKGCLPPNPWIEQISS